MKDGDRKGDISSSREMGFSSSFSVYITYVANSISSVASYRFAMYTILYPSGNKIYVQLMASSRYMNECEHYYYLLFNNTVQLLKEDYAQGGWVVVIGWMSSK